MYTAFLSARVFTGNRENPHAEALLIKDDTIIAVGGNEEIKRQCTAGATKYHLPGNFICPGLVDAHTHIWSLGQTFNMEDLRGGDLPGGMPGGYCQRRPKSRSRRVDSGAALEPEHLEGKAGPHAP